MSDPEWMRCTVAQWEKKAELSMLENDMGEAMKYADYANCREMYENGKTVEEVQARFGEESPKAL